MASLTRIASDAVGLEHIGFGTMNGTDGRPFKTRSGGVMRLKDLIEMLVAEAGERMTAAKVARDYSQDERERIAADVGVAALKFGDLANHPSRDHVFDIDRFASFDGKTGPYLLYTAVRIKSILRKASERTLQNGSLLPPADEIERNLMLTLSLTGRAIEAAFERRAPNIVCEHAYAVASAFAGFYHEHHIINEADEQRRTSWLRLSAIGDNVHALASPRNSPDHSPPPQEVEPSPLAGTNPRNPTRQTATLADLVMV